MRQFVYPMFLIYLLPLLAILTSAVVSKWFQEDVLVVGIAAAMSTALLNVLRDGLGVLLIPLTTAYSVQLRTHKKVPAETKRLLYFLMTVCCISFALHGIIVSHESQITEYS